MAADPHFDRTGIRGKVWLVGAGPGEPGLISVRGLEVLAAAEVVLHDALAHPALLDACPQAELRNVGKRFGEPSSAQERINRELIELARAGKQVVRLKGGDPLLFARGAEEALALSAAGIEFEIVPAVSSPVGAATYAGIPLTHRDFSSSVTFITGSDRAGEAWSPDAWKRLATATDTICVLMGMRRLEEIAAAIVEGGRDPQTPVAVIQWGARPEQRVEIGTLSDIAQKVRVAGLKNPAVVVVGEVVRLREELRWYDTRPLFGKRVLVPRALEQAERTGRAIRARGAEPVLAPLIEIAPPPDPEPLRAAVLSLGRYDWVLFTSENGVERTFRALAAAGRDARAFGAAKVGVIGPHTGDALARHGIRADLVAEEHVGEGLAHDLLARGRPGRVLLSRALVARDELPRLLREAGAEVDVVPAYETKLVAPQTFLERWDAGAPNVVLLTSSSIARSLVEALGPNAAERLAGITVASIGPVTTQTAAELGVRVDIAAKVHTLDGLLDALEAHFRASPLPASTGE